MSLLSQSLAFQLSSVCHATAPPWKGGEREYHCWVGENKHNCLTFLLKKKSNIPFNKVKDVKVNKENPLNYVCIGM